jgi:hypothetical protein
MVGKVCRFVDFFALAGKAPETWRIRQVHDDSSGWRRWPEDGMAGVLRPGSAAPLRSDPLERT